MKIIKWCNILCNSTRAQVLLTTPTMLTSQNTGNQRRAWQVRERWTNIRYFTEIDSSSNWHCSCLVSVRRIFASSDIWHVSKTFRLLSTVFEKAFWLALQTIVYMFIFFASSSFPCCTSRCRFVNASGFTVGWLSLHSTSWFRCMKSFNLWRHVKRFTETHAQESDCIAVLNSIGWHFITKVVLR